MSEMVELVARATAMSLQETFGTKVGWDFWEADLNPTEEWKERYRVAARAAIEAMREYTLVYRQDGMVVHELRGAPDDIWKMLLDAALSPCADQKRAV